MSPADVMNFPSDQRDASWWMSSVFVRWEVRREYETPVLLAKGSIAILAADDDDDVDDEGFVEVGSIRIAKVFLWQGDSVMALDAVSGDLLSLGSAVLDGQTYRDDFSEWCEKEFGVMPMGDPVFVDDLRIAQRWRESAPKIAALGVLDALATFGSASSMLVGYHPEAVRVDQRGELRDGGLWSWAHGLRAKRWENVQVAARPQS